ncbi:MAG TPA: L-histidine N(alpha)-methyltransferase [Candidatus Acidoferrales bacterium]|nr:L-histidine N(alpha)-methyltransferase [Candidatus Acidoferrales bacterium]
MKMEVVLTEADIAQEFAEAIEARDLPEKFFFWFPRSAMAWITLVQRAELYGGLWDSWKEIAATAPAIARYFNRRVPVISFGAGDGLRDRLLMKALKDAGCESLYFPVDASQTMLELACGGADDEDIETVGIKADISSPVHLVYAADAAEPPKLFILSGNTMGSFDPLAEIRYLVQCMKPEDRLIVDGEIYDAKGTMGRRDNGASRKFLGTMLASVGIAEDDGEIRFDQKIDSRHDGLHLVTRYFRAGRDLSATVAGEEISLERGERMGMNFQYTYTLEAFRWLLTEHGGLEIESEYSSPDHRFVTAICKK